MDYDALRALLLNWIHVGPFRTFEEYLDQIRAAAKEMGPEPAPLLVETLLRLNEDGDEVYRDALILFLSDYEDLFPEALAAAILARITSSGPPILVEHLGPTRSPDAVQRLRTTLDLTQASDELLIAVASALSDLEGAEAKKWVEELKCRPGLSPEVQKALDIAAHNLSLPLRQ